MTTQFAFLYSIIEMIDVIDQELIRN